MIPNTVPRFVAEPRTWQLKLAASTPRATAQGANTTLFITAQTSGITRVDWFRIEAQTEVADSLFYIFKLDGSGTSHLFDEISVSATSAGSGNVADFEAELTPTKPLYLKGGESVYVGSNTTTGTMSIFATGGHF